MKTWMALALSLACTLGLTACGGNVDNVQITDYTSAIYSDEEIQSAIEVTLDYFEREFEGCTLTELTYLGDDRLGPWLEYAERYQADDVIVFVSSFEVNASGGDGSFNPNDTYTGWSWILVRDDGGKWKFVDGGY